jgi:hypothetical protein
MAKPHRIVMPVVEIGQQAMDKRMAKKVTVGAPGCVGLKTASPGQ